MSFVVAAALAIALFVAVPVAAHLLRRGRTTEREFPPARLVPSAPPVARQRSRLEDRLLLGIRGALLVALALLGAMPLVRCSRLGISRESGGSVALALVMDDSLSMRARLSGGTRWEHALRGARDLLRSMREGDSVAIILAGHPARLTLAATTDIAAARRTLDEIVVSDRSTDLAAGVAMARSTLRQLPHGDKRVVVLSDLASDDIPPGDPPPWFPLDQLRSRSEDCGVVHAERRGKRVRASIACSSAGAARGRSVEVLLADADADRRADAGAALLGTGPLGRTALAERAGLQEMTIDLAIPAKTDVSALDLDLRLAGSDAIGHDDLAPVASEATALSVAMVVDPSRATVATGGTTLLEQAFAALESGAQLHPLTLLPDDASDLSRFAAIAIDDPPGLSPESRRALDTWLQRGGVALALLGPAVRAAQLGFSLEPFATAMVPWAETKAHGVDPATVPSWWTSDAKTLAALAPSGRAELEGALPTGARVAARWNDGHPFLLERDVGRGLAFTVGLPSSSDISDFPLRPGFLALLDRVVGEAATRRGPRFTVAGHAWSFAAPVRIVAPSGSTATIQPAGNSSVGVYVPAELGRYRVHVGNEVQLRIVGIDGNEITRSPREPTGITPRVQRGGAEDRVDISREVALLVLALFAAEALARAAMRWHKRS